MIRLLGIRLPVMSVNYQFTCFVLFRRLAQYYVKTMERVISKGDSFITAEISRLERLLGMELLSHGGEGRGGERKVFFSPDFEFH